MMGLVVGANLFRNTKILKEEVILVNSEDRLVKFFRQIYGDQEGYIAVATIYQSGKFEELDPCIYPDDLEVVIKNFKYYNRDQEACVYFCPHLIKYISKGRKKENASPLKCLWSDIDYLDEQGLTPNEIKPLPSICWQTSKGRYQAVWLLDKFIDPIMGENLNKNLNYNIPGADKGGWHLGKLLRVPGTINWKIFRKKVR